MSVVSTRDGRLRDLAAPELVPLFDVAVDLAPALDFGAGPAGRRVFYRAAGGTFSGERLEGDVVAGGGDWAVFDADGSMRLDVRLTLRIRDGSLVHMTYGGRLVMPSALARTISDDDVRSATDPDRYYFRTNPLFETGAADHRWLNDVVAVGIGYLIGGGVAYSVFEVR